MPYDMSVREVSNASFGRLNKHIISDTSTHTFDRPVGVIHASTDTVVESMTDSNILSGSASGLIIYAGDDYLGNISSIKLTSGTVIAYEV